MESNPTGKSKIKKYEYLKNDEIRITLENGKSFVALKETIINYGIFKKDLDANDIKDVLEKDRIVRCMQIAVEVAKNRDITEKQLIIECMNRGMDLKTSQAVLKRMKKYDLISDKALILDYQIFGLDKCYGAEKVRQLLRCKGFDQEIVDNVKFPIHIERKKCANYIRNHKKPRPHESLTARRRRIANALTARGFTQEIADEAVQKIKK